VQVFQLGLVAFALIAIAIRLDALPSKWNLLSTLFWLLTAAFYVLSDRIFPFVLFPWLSVAALYPLPINFMLTFDAEALPVAIATWVWGLLLALASELVRRLKLEKIRRYGLPALTGSLLVILTAIFIGYIEDITYGFILLLASSILYTLLHLLNRASMCGQLRSCWAWAHTLASLLYLLWKTTMFLPATSCWVQACSCWSPTFSSHPIFPRPKPGAGRCVLSARSWHSSTWL
jgi:hypothetical protein